VSHESVARLKGFLLQEPVFPERLLSIGVVHVTASLIAKEMNVKPTRFVGNFATGASEDQQEKP
jgi:hypothetical protein